MQIEPGNKIILPTMPELDIPQKETPKTTAGSFDDVLKGLVSETNSLQKQAGDIQEKFLLGEVQDIHSVMIAAEKASVAFNLVMEIRNKLLESYQTLLRIPL
ncbi:MAG: flagellar hook-basal body complex protein FliE [candidate division Zixibacteria bacterium]|nr:flagellar hook-basal body complex protein FliE [candidate division Zixibacteria bacterium]